MQQAQLQFTDQTPFIPAPTDWTRWKGHKRKMFTFMKDGNWHSRDEIVTEHQELEELPTVSKDTLAFLPQTQTIALPVPVNKLIIEYINLKYDVTFTAVQNPPNFTLN